MVEATNNSNKNDIDQGGDISPDTFFHAITLNVNKDARCLIITIHDKKGWYDVPFCIESLFTKEEKEQIIKEIEEKERKEGKKYEVYFVPTPNDLIPYIMKFLENETRKKNVNIYYTPNLHAKPFRNDDNVKISYFLFGDQDFKETIDNPDKTTLEKAEKKECTELDDHALECWYKDGSKVVHVKRPPLSENIKAIEEKLGVKPTIIIDSGNGYQFLIKIKTEKDDKGVGIATWQELEFGLIKLAEKKGLEIDDNVKNPSRLLRVPGSINTRNGRTAKVIYYDPFTEYSIEQLKEKLKIKEERETTKTSIKELSNNQISSIIDILKPYYKPGHRDEIVFSLLGTLVKNGFSYESAKKLIETLATLTGDEEKDHRLYLVDYHYGKRAEDIGIEKLKGVSGIRDTIEKMLFSEYGDNDRARGETLEILRRFTEILGIPLEPHSIFTITKINDNVVQFFANDRKWGITFITKKNGITTTEPILDYFIERVKVQINPNDSTDRTYSVYFRNPYNNMMLPFEERKLGSIIEHFEKTIASIRNTLKLKSAIHSIISRFEELRLAEFEPKVLATGFFEVDKKLQYFETRQFQTHLPEFDRERDKEKVIKAFNELGELLSFWDYKDHVIGNLYFDVQSPIAHIRKAYGRENKILYNYGSPHVGKTFRENIYRAIWGLDENKALLSGANLTVPQIAYYMSITTFKISLDEGFNLIINQWSADMIKKSTTSYHVKTRLKGNDYEPIEFEAYSSLSINTNFDPTKYPGLPDRLIPFRWTLKDKKTEKEFNELANKLNKYRDDLGYIGAYLKDMFLRRWDEIKEILLNNDNIEAGRKILEMVYDELGIEKPKWLKPIEIDYNIEPQHDEDILFDFIRDDIIDRLSKNRYNYTNDMNGEKKTEDILEKSWEDRLEYMVQHTLLPGYMKLGRRIVFIKKSVEDEIKRRKGYILTGGLEDIAYRLGYKYYPNGERGISIPIDDFIKRMSQYIDETKLMGDGDGKTIKEEKPQKKPKHDKTSLEEFL